jgi:hypothetical protein
MVSELARCYRPARDLVDVVRMRRSTKCILPESAPAVKFDDEGVCSQCRTHKKISYKDEGELQKVLDPYRGKVTKRLGRRERRPGQLLHPIKDCQRLRLKVLAVNYKNVYPPTSNSKHKKCSRGTIR